MYKITNGENICVICERLLDYIRSTTEQSIKNDVAKKLNQLANQYLFMKPFLSVLDCTFSDRQNYVWLNVAPTFEIAFKTLNQRLK